MSRWYRELPKNSYCDIMPITALEAAYLSSETNETVYLGEFHWMVKGEERVSIPEEIHRELRKRYPILRNGRFLESTHSDKVTGTASSSHCFFFGANFCPDR